MINSGQGFGLSRKVLIRKSFESPLKISEMHSNIYSNPCQCKVQEDWPLRARFQLSPKLKER